MMRVLIVSLCSSIPSVGFSLSYILDSDPKELNLIYENKDKLKIKFHKENFEKFKCNEDQSSIDCGLDFNISFLKNNNGNIFLTKMVVNYQYRNQFYAENSDFYKAIYSILKINSIHNEREIKNYFKKLKSRLKSKEFISSNEYTFKNGISINFYDTATYTNNLETSDYKFYIYKK